MTFTQHIACVLSVFARKTVPNMPPPISFMNITSLLERTPKATDCCETTVVGERERGESNAFVFLTVLRRSNESHRNRDVTAPRNAARDVARRNNRRFVFFSTLFDA